MKVGIIDTGTNTFHLALFYVTSHEFRLLRRLRYTVNLAEEGLSHIGHKAFERGLVAYKAFAKLLAEEQADEVHALGTAALRRADNAIEFVEAVYDQTRLRIEIIDGLEEARLIYQGVRWAVPLGAQPSLLMDIGGGSVEFILGTRDKMLWTESFDIGAAVLYHRFHHEEPFSPSGQAALFSFLAETLAPLDKALEAYPTQQLIGASGSFDILEVALPARNAQARFTEMDMASFDAICAEVVQRTFEERKQLDYMIDNRAKLATVAILCIDYIIRKYAISRLFTSKFALKEGVLWTYTSLHPREK